MRKVGFEWSSRKVYRSQLVANYSSLTWLFFSLVQQSFRGSYFRGTTEVSFDRFIFLNSWIVLVSMHCYNRSEGAILFFFFLFTAGMQRYQTKAALIVRNSFPNIKINSRSSLYNSRTNTVDFIEIIQTIYIDCRSCTNNYRWISGIQLQV